MHAGKTLSGILIAFAITALGGGGDPIGMAERPTTVFGRPAFGIGWTGSGSRSDSTQTQQSSTDVGSTVNIDGGSTGTEAAAGIGWGGSGN
jgi:hypothetical protein